MSVICHLFQRRGFPKTIHRNIAAIVTFGESDNLIATPTRRGDLAAANPINLIDADWDALALVGAFQRGFERDLDDPRQWQYPDDQPDTKFGGPLLNNYKNPWPPDWYRR